MSSTGFPLALESTRQACAQFFKDNFRLDLFMFYLLVFSTVAVSQDTSHFTLRIENGNGIEISSKHVSEEPSSIAHLQLKGIPFHAIEVLLAITLSAIVFRRFREKHFTIERTSLDPWFGLWILIGLAELLRGILLFGDYSVAFHDFGMVYFVIVFYIAREVCFDWQKIKWLMVIFLAGTVVRIITGNWNYIFGLNYSQGDGVDWPVYGKFMANIAGANILVALLIGIAVWRLTRNARWPLFIYLSFATFSLSLTQQRSFFIALLIGCAILAIGAKALGTVKPLALSRLVMGVVFAGTLVWLLHIGINFSGHKPFLSPLRSLMTKATPIIETSELKGTSRFRQDAWQEAWRRVVENPVLGEGLGKKFSFYDTVQKKWWTFQPHNTYLTILYKMGLIGMVSFLLIHVAFCKMLFNALPGEFSHTKKAYVLGLFGAMVGLQAYGAFNILLERRSLALIYWSLMGVLTTVTSLPEASLEAA